MKNALSKDVKRFIALFVPFILLLIVIDYAVGHALQHYYEKQLSGTLYRTTYSLDSTRAEVLVVGSSRANHHYDAEIIARKLNKSVYNCGRDGQGLLYSSAVISSAIKRYKPALIILDIEPNEFAKDEKERLTCLLPYKDNPEIKPYIDYIGDFQHIKLLSRSYPYNSMLTSITAGNATFLKREKDHFGFLPLSGVMPKNSKPTPREEDETLIAYKKIELFKKLLSELEKQQIQTYIVISPMYSDYKQGFTVETCKKMIAHFKYVKFLNFLNREDYHHYRLFRDATHLNFEGAQKFTSEIVNHLSVQKTEALLATAD